MSEQALQWLVSNPQDKNYDAVYNKLTLDPELKPAVDWLRNNPNDENAEKVRRKIILKFKQQDGFTKPRQEEFTQPANLPAQPASLEDVQDAATGSLYSMQKGATLGLSDDILSHYRTLKSKLGGSSDPYGQLFSGHKKDIQNYSNQLSEEAPVGTFLSELAGSVIGSPTTLGVKGLGATVKMAPKLKALMQRGAIAGGIGGYGYSQKEGTDRLKDAASGAGIGGALPAVGTGIVNLAKFSGEKLFSALTGVTKGIAKRYIARSKQVNSSKSLDDLVESIHDELNTMPSKIKLASDKALDKIPEDAKIELADVDGILMDKVKELEGNWLPENKKSANYFKELSDNLRKEATKNKGYISARSIKEKMKELDRVTQYSDKSGAFDGDALNAAKKDLRYKFDSILKSTFPTYKEAMKGVAALSENLEDMHKVGFSGKESTTARKLRALGNIGSQQQKNMISEKKALQQFDFLTGKGFSEDNLDRAVFDAFQKTNFSGSRNTHLWATIGRLGRFTVGAGAGVAAAGMPQLGGDSDASTATSVAMGALFGALTDRYGPAMGKQILNAYIKTDSGRRLIQDMTKGVQMSGVLSGKAVSTYSSGEEQ